MKVILVRGARANDVPVHKMARALSKAGHEVLVLEWDRERKFAKVEETEGYLCHRFRLKAPYGKISVLSYLPFWELYEFCFLLRHKADVVHACDFDTLLPALAAKLLRRGKLCYTILDFYSDFPGNIPSFVRRLVTGIERCALRYVDCLFMVNEAMYEQVAGAKVRRVVYIYNCPEDHPVKTEVSSRPRAALPLRIFYAGWLTSLRGVRHMVNAVRNLDDVTLEIAGTGPEEEVRQIHDEELVAKGKLRFSGWIPYEQVIEKESEADILFYFFNPESLSGRYASPNKLFQAMMGSKPIIVSDGGWMAEVVRKENCGLVVPFGDVAAITEAIVKLKTNPDLRHALGQNGRRAYEQRYNWGIMSDRLLRAYGEVLTG